MKKISYILNYFVFLAATLAIAGVFYEGMELRWVNTVSIFIVLMDFSFLISTIVNMVIYRKTKWLYINLVSLLLIVIAYIMKGFSIEYSSLQLVFWYFYIWFLYGIQITFRLCKNYYKTYG
jgi:hypothetical protein